MIEREYIHGFQDSEQDRLSRMQRLLNDRQLAAMPLVGVKRVVDFGSGLGQLTRDIARQLDSSPYVIGIEASEEQLARARQTATAEGEQELVEFRQGNVFDPPLAPSERGSFDLVHARFLLEHVRDPQEAVGQMVAAARIDGRIFLMDDDHEQLRLWPPCPELERTWQVYWESYRQLGCDPLVGRRLTELLVSAEAEIESVGTLFYGAAQGQTLFGLVVDNLVEVIASAANLLERQGLLSTTQWKETLAAVQEWRKSPSATVWYSLPFAIGVRTI